jgi:hypothetical protein
MIRRGDRPVVDRYNGSKTRAAGKRAGSRSDAYHSATIPDNWADGPAHNRPALWGRRRPPVGMNKAACGSLRGQHRGSSEAREQARQCRQCRHCGSINARPRQGKQ